MTELTNEGGRVDSIASWGLKEVLLRVMQSGLPMGHIREHSEPISSRVVSEADMRGNCKYSIEENIDDDGEKDQETVEVGQEHPYERR